MKPAPAPARGSYAEGFADVAETFAAQLEDEVGASFAAYHHGERVVDLWGGKADRARAWERDTRIVVFSVTKGLTAMAFALLTDRGQLDWDAPVAQYWPGFAGGGKGAITVATLLEHRAGLVGLDVPITLDECIDGAPRVLAALEAQRPSWQPGTQQGYHAITFGLFARELFERIAGEDLGGFLRRELFTPLGADVDVGTPPVVDARIATLYPPSNASRVVRMLGAAIRGNTAEGRIARDVIKRGSLARAAFSTPSSGPLGLAVYNTQRVRRAQLAWANATASADGLARAYAPFALGGAAFGKTYLSGSTLAPIYLRQHWSENDLVLHKPIGWSRGFVKEQGELFSPNLESFGHPGMGGALGWADPVAQLSFGYTMNKLDYRVRSPRTIALCHALYRSVRSVGSVGSVGTQGRATSSSESAG
ncbi:MAG: serine hydrolase domain-containing protein [Kofleriaceae bacterium]